MDDFINNVLDQIVNPIIYLLFGLAVLYFVYGVLDFIKNAAAPEKKPEGAKHIMWGIIGLFIMVSAIGLKHIIESTVQAL